MATGGYNVDQFKVAQASERVIVYQPSSCSNAAVGFCMINEELILVTGATGFLGARLVQELLARQPHAMLALLIRDRVGQSGQQRADSIVPPAERSRVQVYSGDVGQPNCGLDAAA